MIASWTYPLGFPLFVYFHEMYCSLEDAFPSQSHASAQAQPGAKNVKLAKYPGSCWMADAPDAREENDKNQAVILGANVQSQLLQQQQHKQQHVPIEVVKPASAHDLNAKEESCFSALHHCLSCATCQRLLFLHYLSQTGVNSENSEKPANVHRHRRKSHKTPRFIVGAQVTESVKSENPIVIQTAPITNRPVAKNVLSEPISVGSNITWGHLLVLFAAGGFLLLVIDRLKN